MIPEKNTDPIQPRHGFYVVTESSPPLSQTAVKALLQAGLKLEGTLLRSSGPKRKTSTTPLREAGVLPWTPWPRA